jgi:uncharacterized protein (DUF1501 family)
MLTRRVLLKTGGVALLALGAGPRFLDRLALATPTAGRRRLLVSIFLRGAMDGLMAVPPLDEPALRRLRPRLAMSAARSGEAPLLDLDGRFGLHPAFAPLRPYWADGRLAIVHGVGSPHPTRSHFDAQDFMENGTPGRRSTPSGWLNRLAAVSGDSASPFRAVSMTPDLPRSLYGDEPALAIEELSHFQLQLPGDPELAEKIGGGIEALYRVDAAGDVERRSREMFDALRVFSQEDLERYRGERENRYPRSQLGHSLLQIAYLIKAGAGLEIACAESDGWDTHVGQGTAHGPFARRARDLAESLAAFWEDLGPHRDEVVVLTMTEFGRTVRENGSAGTDHGHGSCLFVLGDWVDGGKVHGELPSLEPDALFEGRDLPVTTDFRSVFAGVAGRHFGVADDRLIFPGWQGPRLPLLRG